MPAAPAQHWIASRAEVAGGEVERHRFGSDVLANERRIWVYTPPHDEASGERYGLLIVLDISSPGHLTS